MYKDIEIYIPSIGRSYECTTPGELSMEARKVSTIITKPEEVERYAQRSGQMGIKVIAQESSCTNIGHVRKWMIDNCKTKYLMMLDDDLRFYYRPKPGDWHLKYLKNTDQFDEMISFLMERVRKENIAHASIAFREGSNNQLEDWAYNTRYSRLFVYDVTQMKDIILGRMQVMEDFDIALQLIRKGRPSLVCYKYAQGQKSSGAKGGCSTYRSLEVQREAALELARLHAPFVKAVEKTTKTAWGGATRTDVLVHWKKAFESSKAGASDGVIQPRIEASPVVPPAPAESKKVKRLKKEKVQAGTHALQTRPGTLDEYIIKEQKSSYGTMRFQGKRVMDVGANIGAFADFANKMGAIAIECYEPEPENFEFLLRNCDPIGAGCNNFALVGKDQPETMEFYTNRGINKGSHSLYVSRGRDKIIVDTMKFMDEVENFKPDLIKIDIEGGEYHLFDYSKPLPDFVTQIAVELHFGKKEWREKSCLEVCGYLKRQGFEFAKYPKLDGKNFHTMLIAERPAMIGAECPPAGVLHDAD